MLKWIHIITTVKNKMVDLHTHVLPYIDDGASSYEEAIEMLTLMERRGITTVVATPHFDFENKQKDQFLEQRNKSLNKLRNLVSEHKLNIRLVGGAELMFSSNIYNYDLDDLTIEGTDYVLIELSTRRNEPSLENSLQKLIANGYIPILAHIERYRYLIEHSNRLVNLIEMGVLMQINVTALHSPSIYPFISTLKRKNLVHVISSDAHNMTIRGPNLIASEIESEYHINQQLILKNCTLILKKPKRLYRIFGRYF